MPLAEMPLAEMPLAEMPLTTAAPLDQPDGLAPPTCRACHTKDVFKVCDACVAVYYCCHACQVLDRESHRKHCRTIKEARLHYRSESKKMRNFPIGFSTTENFMKTRVGHFWGIYGTKRYMRARHSLVDVLLLSYGAVGGSAYVVQTALDHLLDMLRLDRCDGMGVRDRIPSLYVRLGRDQDAYDFIKWYTAASNDADFEFRDTSLPFLDLKNANVFESPDEWLNQKWMDLSHVVAIALVKVRILLDLQAIQNARVALRGALPAEIIELICGQLVGSVMAKRPDLLLAGPADTAQLAEKLRSHIRALYKSVQGYNAYAWKTLVENPDGSVLQRPDVFTPGTRKQTDALLAVYNSHAAWYETPGAVGVLRSLAAINSG